MLSKRANNTKVSAIMGINTKATQMKLKGINVIDLSVGEPDMSTPDNIKAAAITAIQAQPICYTAANGMIKLREAISLKLKRDNNLSYDPATQIAVCGGAKQVLFNAFMVVLNSGEEAIIPSPYWTSYPEMIMLADGKPVIVECTAEENFKLTPQKLHNAISANTKLVLLNSPSNPTGMLYSSSELKALSEVLMNHKQICVITDDIYEHIIFDNNKFVSILEVEPLLYDRTIVINGFSKAYCMTGWRMGYGAGPMTLIKAITALQSQSTSNACTISQFASIEALNGPQDFVYSMSQIFEKRRNTIMSALDTQAPELKYIKPDGAFYLFIDCRDMFYRKSENGIVIKNAVDFADYLLQQQHIAVVPGEAFGAPGFIRLSFATSENILRDAAKRIGDGCKNLIK